MASVPRKLRLRAPAKVNLYLEVLGRRADGYHNLRMLTAPVSLFDQLTLEVLDEEGRIEVECEGSGHVASGEQNLCHRAARYYFAESGVRSGVQVCLQKHIPVGAGLGGGSSDAAATILGLETLFAEVLSPESRRQAAFAVGADVPFFFAQSAAWVEGVGEIVRPLGSLPRLWLVLVHPGVVLSTRTVYSRVSIGLTTPGQAHTITTFDFSGIAAGLRNDLQPAALALEPSVGRVLDALRRAGSTASLMSGSGSAAFGVFPRRALAHQAASALSREPEAQGWRIEVVHTLPAGAFPFC